MLAVHNREWDLLSNIHLKRDMSISCYAYGDGFQLREDGVTLLEVMQQQISGSDYAFLFACQTRIEDEKVSDEAIHLAAATLADGYRGVWKKRRKLRIDMGPRFDETTMEGTLVEVTESERGDDC